MKKLTCKGYVVETYTTEEMVKDMKYMISTAIANGALSQADGDKVTEGMVEGWLRNTVRTERKDAVCVAREEVENGRRVRVSPAQIAVNEKGVWQGGYTITGVGTIYEC